MAFTALEDVQINHKYAVYCAWGRNGVCLADDDTDETIANLPLIDIDHKAELGYVSKEGVRVDVWTKPLTQQVYADCLLEYAYSLCGKQGDLGDEASMEANGWKRHTIHTLQ